MQSAVDITTADHHNEFITNDDHNDAADAADAMDIDDQTIIDSVSALVSQKRVNDQNDFESLIKDGFVWSTSDEQAGPLIANSRQIRQIVSLVIDTNYLILHLPLVSSLARYALQRLQQHDSSSNGNFDIEIIVPWVVLLELDGLKSEDDHIANRKAGHGYNIHRSARRAIDFLHESIAKRTVDGGPYVIRGQKLTDCIDEKARGDDAILDCCRFLTKEQKNAVLLLSNDKNLAIKCAVHEIPTVGHIDAATVPDIMSKAAAASLEHAQNSTFSGQSDLNDTNDANDANVEIMDIDDYETSWTMEKELDSRFPAQGKVSEATARTPFVQCNEKDRPPDKCEMISEIYDQMTESFRYLAEQRLRESVDDDFAADYFLSAQKLDSLVDIAQLLSSYSMHTFGPLLPQIRGRQDWQELIESARRMRFWRMSKAHIGVTKQELDKWLDKWEPIWLRLAKEPDRKAIRAKCTLYRQWIHDMKFNQSDKEI